MGVVTPYQRGVVTRDTLAKPLRLSPKRDLRRMREIGLMGYQKPKSDKLTKIVRSLKKKILGNEYRPMMEEEMEKMEYNFNWDWSIEFSDEWSALVALENVKARYYAWCSENTFRKIEETGRPNWWGMDLVDQHKNSPSFIPDLLREQADFIEYHLYEYRQGFEIYTQFVDTSGGDITGGGNGEPPYKDPSRMNAIGEVYDGPDILVSTNAFELMGDGILYNTRLYNDDGSQTHVPPLKKYSNLPSNETRIKREQEDERLKKHR